MNIKFNKEPFDFLVIDEFLDSVQYKDVRNEIDFFVSNDHINKKSERKFDGSAEDEEGKSLAKRHSLWLNNLFVNHREQSKIYKHIQTNFLFSDLPKQYPNSILLKYLPYTNSDSTLLSFFQKGDYYKSHNDFCIITAILYLINDQDFQGGEIVFDEFNITHKPLNNQMIVFPSCVNHEVKTIECEESLTNPYKRISITTFVNIK